MHKNKELETDICNTILSFSILEEGSMGYNQIYNFSLVNDLGYDSIRFIELITKLEDIYNFEFQDDLFISNKLSTVHDIKNIVEEMLKKS